MADDLMTIGTFPDLMSAQFYLSLLEENGIKAFVPEECTAIVAGVPMMYGVAEIRLQVDKKDAEAALDILAGMEDRKQLQLAEAVAEDNEDLNSDEVDDNEVDEENVEDEDEAQQAPPEEEYHPGLKNPILLALVLGLALLVALILQKFWS